MIKRLRIKLIAVSMLSMFIVLASIVCAINIFNYNKIVTDADAILTVLNENNGKFPEAKDNLHMPSETIQSDGSDTLLPPPTGFSSEKNDGEFKEFFDDPFNSPETRYESRFFSVTLDNEGTAKDTESMQIAAVNKDEALIMAENIWKTGNKKGFLDNYRYLLSSADEGYRITFLDCMRSMSGFKNTLITSILVSLSGLLAVFILVLIFSRRIVRPISESYDKQKEFITNAGHEIKTPLAIINADAEVLESDTGENEWIDDIKAQTTRLTSLTNDLVFLAKMEETENSSEMIEFPFSDMVNEIIKPFNSLAITGHKVFSHDIEEGLSIKGDEKGLSKLVSILLDNAMKYTPKGGTILSSLSKQKNKIILTVSNTTKDDLVKEDLEHFFDRFYRTDKSRNSKTGGYGIGLSVADAVVKRHKGKIRAYPKDQRFLVIEASLPIQ